MLIGFGLPSHLLQSMCRVVFATPALIQQKAIPFARTHSPAQPGEGLW